MKKNVSGDEKERCNDYITAVYGVTYERLKERHLNDYLPLFHACSLDLGGDEAALYTTTERMERMCDGKEDPHFVTQYFQYAQRAATQYDPGKDDELEQWQRIL